ncbi:MAG: tRNA (adenosine(37)-N6)-threonylcarbamoyltransferase complex dimerization subunit type 1 TsaB [Candidatus Omnitrophica bacterium]|nr:tRNA (adenosine(37)-N6)-threonylcarbamoyltransferase complex dimerization subunit type 1 TsaB [Candidatus Omnitrophota bacterium]
MNILALETSSSVLTVALKRGPEEILESNLREFNKHGEHLVPVIRGLLKIRKLSIKNIHTFVIDRGPGSFTGLRIGFATLKGFLAAKKKSCYGCLSLDMIAENIEIEEGSKLAVCLDAYRGRIYNRVYERRESHWHPVTQPQTVSLEDLSKKLPGGIYVIGDAIRRYRENLIESGLDQQPPKKFYFLPEKFWYPTAKTMIRTFLIWRRISDKRGQPLFQKLVKAEDFVPLYLRSSEAEEKRKYHVVLY